MTESQFEKASVIVKEIKEGTDRLSLLHKQFEGESKFVKLYNGSGTLIGVYTKRAGSAVLKAAIEIENENLRNLRHSLSLI